MGTYTSGRLIGLAILIVVVGGYTLIDDAIRWPLKDTAIGQEILAEKQSYAGADCSRRLAAATDPLFRGTTLGCRCFFNVLIDHQVPLRQLMTSDKRAVIYRDAMADCT